MVLGICDDNAEERKKLELLCLEILEGMGTVCEILQFSNGTELLGYEGGTIDLLLLDIEMPRMNGIEVKNILQNKGKETLILFVTDHEEQIFSAFGIHVYGFVKKNQMMEALKEMLPSAINILQQWVMIHGEIDSRKVVYIKSERIYSILKLEDGTEYLLRCSLRKLEQQLLSVGFYRVHKSYLMNFQWVIKISGGKIVTKQGEIPIAVRQQSEIKKAYFEFCERNARY